MSRFIENRDATSARVVYRRAGRIQMRHRFVAVAAVLAAFSLSLVGQTSPKSKTYTPPKTPWGEPDIQGSWPAQFNIPRERPQNLKDNVLSDEAFVQRQAQTAKQFQARQQAPDNGIGPPANWGEIGKPARQTSLVVDPPDGRMPPLTLRHGPSFKRSGAAAVPASTSPTRSIPGRISTTIAAALRAVSLRPCCTPSTTTEMRSCRLPDTL